uniref:Glutathione S-transferase n=1 Tax=uncultured gamma proteobacterium HF0200_24F15 TaxID=723570 RepID=E7C3Y5_9GAMM|nr:glutathione S-transferase [uncultured gamma proteobacterium HF0200_24F15]
MEYRIVPVNIGLGEQFEPSFLQIAPNNRIPAIVDDQPVDGGASISVFESGAILLYLAEKSGKLIVAKGEQRVQIIEWLMWQMANLGPMLGQNHHFVTYAPEKVTYAIDRYVNETSRLYAVLDRRLSRREFIADTYSIADIACYPWIVSHERQLQDLNMFPNLKRWFEAIRDRPATRRAYAKGLEINDKTTMSDEAKKILFGQTEAVVQNIDFKGNK